MTDKIRNSTRIVLGICGLGLLLVLITPIWRIELSAPQYPEGLYLLIHANKLSGNVDIINGLNHYIGMKTLHADDFVEFKVLPGIIIFFSVLFVLAAIIARKRFVNIAFGLFVVFGALAMIDFWRWEYDYGHNLDPNAAIIVPGMAYQPPLIGFKQLLNFGAYSIPDIGGWIFIGVGVTLLALVIREWKGNKKSIRSSKIASFMVFIVTFALSSCNTEPQPIVIGKDQCDYCKMTISDARFGSELITQKNKIYKFDDPHCVLSFIRESNVQKANISKVYFVNFNKPHELLDAEKANFLQSPSLRSPMNGNIAAFTHIDSLEKALVSHFGNIITWEDMQK